MILVSQQVILDAGYWLLDLRNSFLFIWYPASARLAHRYPSEVGDEAVRCNFSTTLSKNRLLRG